MKIFCIVVTGLLVCSCTPPAFMAGSGVAAIVAAVPGVITEANTDTQIAVSAAPVICKAGHDAFADFVMVSKSFNVGSNMVARANRAMDNLDIVCETIKNDNPQTVVGALKTALDAYRQIKLARQQAQLAAVTK